MAQQARDHDDLGSAGLAQPLLEGGTYRVRGEVLVLDVDVPLRPRDHVEVQVLDFTCVPLCGGDSGAVTAIATGTSTTAGSSSSGQRIPVRVSAGTHFFVDVCQRSRAIVAEHARRLAVDRDHHVVEGRIRPVGRHATRLVGSMLRRVPALAGQVDASAKRDRIVDDDDLLVMRAAGRMRVVELQVHAPMRFPAPSPSHGRRRFAIRRVDHREVPVEHVDVKVAPATCQVVQIAAELGARALVLAAIIEAAAAVEVPRDDEDRLGGELGGAHEHA